MKKIIVFVFLVLAVMIVAGCQSSTLAGQATKDESSACKANKDCNALFGVCSKEKQCVQQSAACGTACTTEFGSGNAVKNCKATKCTPAYLTCLNGCYDTAIAAWKGGQTAPAAAGPAKDANGLVFGDINLDGKLTSSDLQCYALVAQNPLATCMPASASKAPVDLNCDGKIDAVDQALAAKLLVGDASAVDGNKNGVLDCKEAKTCTPGPTGVVKCVQLSSYPNQWYAVQEQKAADCSVSVDQNPKYGQAGETWCGPSSSATSCVDGKGCCTTSVLWNTCLGDKIDNGTKNSCSGQGHEQFDCSTVGLTCGVVVAGDKKGCAAKVAQPGTCTDSDNSGLLTGTTLFNKSSYVAGSVIMNGTYIFNDYCKDNKVVIEKLCTSSSGSDWNAYLYDCSLDGTTCQDGACVNTTSSGSGGSSSSTFSCGSDKNTVTNSTVSSSKCDGWLSTSQWDCKTDNTTFAGCHISMSDALSKCQAANTCKN